MKEQIPFNSTVYSHTWESAHIYNFVNVYVLAVLKIALCCCRLCGCHGRGMWATCQLRSALQNWPKICYSNTHFPLEEWRNGWMEIKCYFN